MVLRAHCGLVGSFRDLDGGSGWQSVSSAVHLGAWKDFREALLLWPWIYRRSREEKFAVQWFRCAAAGAPFETAVAVYEEVSVALKAMASRRSMLDICIQADLERSLTERILSDMLVQTNLEPHDLVFIHQEACSLSFDVLEYQALRRMMDDGVPLERHHLFRHGLLESTVFHRPDRAAISFSKLIDIGGLEASNFELIYEQAFSHLDEALQIRLLKAWELTVSGEAQGRVLGLILTHLDPEESAHEYQLVLDKLESFSPNDETVWELSVAFLKRRGEYARLIELHRRWLMHLSGDRRHSAIRELARLESEFGDPVEGVELLLSLRNEDLFVEEFDWLYAQSSRVDLLQTFAKVLESLQSTQAEMLC